MATDFISKKTHGPDLRWELIYNEDVLKERGIVKYNERTIKKENGETVIQKVPQWVVLDRKSDEIVPYDSTGNSHTHPLLIRKIPNKMIKSGSGEIIFIVEGPHGDVTLGFKKLLEKEDIFNEWIKDAKKYEYFESMFKIKVSRRGIAKPVEIKYQTTEEITKFN